MKAARAPSGVLLTSYEQLRKHSLAVLSVNWGYVVLDEGHKIRNPDADITLLCKQVLAASALFQRPARPTWPHSSCMPCCLLQGLLQSS